MVGTNFRFLPMDHLLERNCEAAAAAVEAERGECHVPGLWAIPK